MTGCYAKGCKNHTRAGVKLSFFPKNPFWREIWINNCKKFGATTYTLPHDHSALCEYHFTADMWEKPRVDGKKKLKFRAEPTIFGDLVVQVKNKPKAIPTKVGSVKTIVIHTNPDTKGIEIMTLPMYETKHTKLIPKNETNVKKESSIQNQVPTNVSRSVLSIAPRKVSLPLNNNVTSSYTGHSPPKVAMESIKTNNDSRIQNGTQEVEKNQNIHNEINLQDEDSDTDSFIANNFEPVSDDEMDLNENFEPVSDDDLVMNEKSSEQPKAEIKLDTNEKQLIVDPKLDPIMSEEYELYSLQRAVNDSYSSIPRCGRCAMVEKVCMKSERIRVMMKMNCKKNGRQVNRTVKALEAKIKLLEGNQQILHKILNDDQIYFLAKNQKKVSKWSHSTLDKAIQYLDAFGNKGYELLLSHNWPLPSIKSVRRRKNELTTNKNQLTSVTIELETENTIKDSCDS